MERDELFLFTELLLEREGLLFRFTADLLGLLKLLFLFTELPRLLLERETLLLRLDTPRFTDFILLRPPFRFTEEGLFLFVFGLENELPRLEGRDLKLLLPRSFFAIPRLLPLRMLFPFLFVFAIPRLEGRSFLAIPLELPFLLFKELLSFLAIPRFTDLSVRAMPRELPLLFKELLLSFLAIPRVVPLGLPVSLPV